MIRQSTLKITMTQLFVSISLLMSLVLFSAISHAEIIAADSFEDYSTGNITGNNSGSGWAAAWQAGSSSSQAQIIDVSSSPLSYTDSASNTISGGDRAIKIDKNHNEAAKRTLSQSYDDTVIYASMLIQFNGSQNNNDFLANWIESSTYTKAPNFGIKMNQGGGSGTADFFTRTKSGKEKYATNLTSGQTYFLVMKLWKTGNESSPYDRAELWVNPSTLENEPASSTSTSSAASAIKNFTHIGFRSVYLESTDSVIIDRIIYGTSWEDVVGLESRPEPIINLHFDEDSWDGTLGEVIDSSGNNNNATGINGVIAIDSSPAIIGDPGTCGYASFDGVNDYVALDNFQNLTGSFSFTAWVQSTKHSRGRIIADDDTSGFALSLNEPSPGYLRFYSRSVTPISLDTSSVVLPQNDGWYFVSIVHDAGSKRRFIYVDGVLVASDASAYSGTWPSDSGVTTIGSESNASLEGVNFAPFKGNIDEVQIFTEALTQAQIQSLMTETHACTNESTPDPAACNFVSGDYSLYGATSINLAHNITVNGQTVSSGNYSPDVAIDNTGNITTNANPSLPALNPSSFPTNTATNDEISNSDISINSSSEMFYDKIQTKNKSSITFTGGGPFHIDELNTQKEESEINFAAGTYYIRKLSLSKEKTNLNITSSPVIIHIGSSFDIDKEDININKDGNVDDFIVYLHSGATFRAQKENVDFTGLLYGPDAGGIRFDKENIDFHGLMITGNGSIEVKKEDFSLTFTEADKTAVNAILGTCDAALDHFELSYSANGLTCLPSIVTVKACANADCSSLYTESVDVTLEPATGWENNPVTISSGSASLELQHTSVEDVVVDIAATTVSPTGALQCFNGDNADPSCTINFAETGFIFDVPTLTACKTSADVTIQAVRKSNITDQCVGALTGTQSVNFWSTYLLPSTGTKSVAISGNTIDKSSPGSSVDLEFDINGEASFTVQYDDAGQLQLDASHTLTTTDGNLTIAGNDTFVSKPVALAIYSTDNSADCSAGDASCSIFKKAGESFDLDIKAACWVDNDDSDYSNNPVTANFELASIGLDHSLIAPSAGNLGSLSNASINFTTSDNGIHTVSQSVSEVGVFTFDLNPPIYFGESINTAASDNIGRFYPDHFEVTASDDGAFSDYACGTFSYSGQSFNYTTNPTLTISAYNAADTAVITQNYTGDFVKLVASDFRFTQPTTDALQTGVDGNLVLLEMSVSPASLTDNADGSLSFAFGNDSYTYRHISNSKIAPFSNAVKLEFTAINDDDGVQTQDLPISLQPSGEPIRFGRFSITNVHGSELIPLPVQIQTEYFNGANWQSNSADQCTTLNLASHFQLANTDTSAGSWQSGTTTMTVNNGSSTASLNALNSGQATLTFSAPGEDNQGYIDIRSQLSANYDWLLGDYDNDGGYDDEAQGRASFGLFKGSDNIIFRREVY